MFSDQQPTFAYLKILNNIASIQSGKVLTTLIPIYLNAKELRLSLCMDLIDIASIQSKHNIQENRSWPSAVFACQFNSNMMII